MIRPKPFQQCKKHRCQYFVQPLSNFESPHLPSSKSDPIDSVSVRTRSLVSRTIHILELQTVGGKCITENGK